MTPRTARANGVIWSVADEVKFPTVIEGRVEGRRLHISVHNIHTGAIQDEYWFNAR